VVVCACAIAAAGALVVIAPQLNFTARATPSWLETRLAGYVLRRAVRNHAAAQPNPLPATAENIKAGEHEYLEHCAVCHAPDGSARDLLGADFFPPIARLARGAPSWSDGELYYIIANGIRYTGMPGFGQRHDPGEIWKMILWIRHLPHLTAQEKAELNQRGECMPQHEQHSPAPLSYFSRGKRLA